MHVNRLTSALQYNSKPSCDNCSNPSSLVNSLHIKLEEALTKVTSLKSNGIKLKSEQTQIESTMSSHISDVLARIQNPEVEKPTQTWSLVLSTDLQPISKHSHQSN